MHLAATNEVKKAGTLIFLSNNKWMHPFSLAFAQSNDEPPQAHVGLMATKTAHLSRLPYEPKQWIPN